MGLLDLFRNPPADGSSSELPRICYAAAYYVLPHLAFSEVEIVIEHWDAEPAKACEVIYALACKIRNLPVNPADSRKLRMHAGALDESRRYYVVEYPNPPPFDPTTFTPARPPVLAPYFSAIIRSTTTGLIRYYVLGQSPIGSTTFRSVNAEGTNANLGEGPEPRFESWIQHLRQRA